MECLTHTLVITILLVSDGIYGKSDKSNKHLYILRMVKTPLTQSVVRTPSTSLTSCILFCQQHGKSSMFDENICSCVSDQQSGDDETPSLPDDNQLRAKEIEYYGACKHECHSGNCLNWNNDKGFICRNNDGFELQQEYVCFQPTNDRYGLFQIQRSGVVSSLKLVHANGTTTCWRNVVKEETYFGCLGPPDQLYSRELIGVVISDINKNLLFPMQPLNVWGYYKLPGYLPSSKVIIFDGYKLRVSEGQYMKLWYGEDFLNIVDFDNYGHKHTKECTYQPAKCSFCQENLSLDVSIEDHLEKCQNFFTDSSCFYASQGCPRKFSSKADHIKHLKENVTVHSSHQYKLCDKVQK